MTIELARRLIKSGVVSADDVESALVVMMTEGQGLLHVLSESRPDAVPLIEQELERLPGPAIHRVRPVAELASLLPLGMCERLLAVPVRRDPRTGTIDVAAVDPSDPHLTEEFSFQLQAPIRVLGAPLSEVVGALEGLRVGGASLPKVRKVLELADERTPAFGTRPVKRASGSPGRVSLPAEVPRPPVRASEPPIPLVRRSAVPEPGSAGWPKRSTNPGVGEGRAVPAPQLGEDEAGEPVIGLFRSKAPLKRTLAPDGVDQARMEEAVDACLIELDKAGSPKAVLDALSRALGSVVRRGVLFVHREGGYDGRAATPDVPLDEVRRLRLPDSTPNIMVTAGQAGFYLGPLPRTPVHERLMPVLGIEGDEEVYAVPAGISGRPALVMVASGLPGSFQGSRQLDQLAAAASEALERIVRTRKQDPSG